MILVITLLLGCRRARADPSVELSGATGFGALVAGVTPARFTISPSASVSLRGEGWFFVARNTASFLGATGGRFGIDNETTLGAGLFGELVNVSAGLSLAELSLPICGPRLCGQVRGLAPGADVRLDVFGPYLSGSLGISIACAGTSTSGGLAHSVSRSPVPGIARSGGEVCAIRRPGSGCTSWPIDGSPAPVSCIPGSRSVSTFVPEARAQCGSSARWDPCGDGPSLPLRRRRAVPTATVASSVPVSKRGRVPTSVRMKRDA